MKAIRSAVVPTAIILAWLGGAGFPVASAVPGPSVAGVSHFAKAGTNRIHYVTFGKSGPAVVFVHGWGGNTEFWREQPPALADKAQVILIDLPGHGRSDKPAVEYTMDYFGQAVLQVVRDAGVEKAALVGHSMGVPVICRAYALAPEKVSALVAVDGLLRRPKLDPAQVESFIGPFRAPDYREQVKRFIETMFPNPGTEPLRDWTVSQILATPQYVLSGAMDGMFKTNQPAWDLGQVKFPLLVINAKSPMWTAEYEAWVRALSPKTDYRTIEGPGHFLMLEKPAEFNAGLLAALKGAGLIK